MMRNNDYNYRDMNEIDSNHINYGLYIVYYNSSIINHNTINYAIIIFYHEGEK